MKIATIAATFIVLVLVVTMIVAKPNIETTRFELWIPAVTRDNIEIKVRIFGSYDKEIPVISERARVMTIVREKFAAIDYDEIPIRKLRIMFRDELKEAEERGIYIDSLSIVRVDRKK